MLKTTVLASAAVHVASSAGLSATLRKPLASSAAAKARTQASNYITGLNTKAALGTPSTQAQLDSATAVSGDWYMMTTKASLACDGSTTNSISEGYLMDTCVEQFDGWSVMYSCTEDSSTGVVLLSHTTYTDSACSAGAVDQGAATYSTSCSGNGFMSRCTDTNTYSADMASYSDGGVFMSGYLSESNCNSGLETDAIAYFGGMGCNGFGELYEAESVTAYTSNDCTGSVDWTATYADFETYLQCELDDDNDDEDDNSNVDYDDMAIAIQWTTPPDDDDFCFHVDTKIDYKGVQYTYEDLTAGKEPECSVPHSPSSKGVIISTSCGKTVRVTDTHLMATTKGFQLAYSLKAGDVMFGDYDKDMCTVTSVEKEKSTQQYFGLNCVHSEVLASGLRASTFGDFHTLPSWYMSYVGGLVGTEAASSLGEYIAEWYFQK